MTKFEVEEIVTFHPEEKLIKVKPEYVRPDGVLILDARRDIYSSARRWEASCEGITFPEVVISKGGNILPGGARMPLHIILEDNWKIQCPNNCKSVEIYGSLLSFDGSPPFVKRPDGHSITYSNVEKLKAPNWSLSFKLSVLFLAIASGFVGKWIIDHPKEMEPYSAIAIILFTFVQLVSQARKT